MATVNERLRDFSVSRQIDVLRAARVPTGDVLAVLREADEAIAARLLRVRDPGSATGRRLEAIQSSIRDAIDRQADGVRAIVNPFADEIAQVEAEAAASALRRSVGPVGLDTATPRVQSVVAAMRRTPFEGLKLSEWTARFNQNDFQRTWSTIVRGVTIGQTNDEIVRAVVGSRGLRFKDGVREVSRRSARTLVRTSTIHAATQGREAVWEANSDLIDGVLWVSTLDGRTTPICQSLDGDTFPTGEGPRPPIHFNCRSAVTPIVKGADELGLPPATRASMDGQVPEDVTYQDWLGGRSAEFQDEVLGPTKGALFRRGGVKLDRFVDEGGKPLTIEDLRRRVPKAFTEAGLE